MTTAVELLDNRTVSAYAAERALPLTGTGPCHFSLTNSLTNDCHQRVEIADVDTLLCHVDEIFNHTNTISFLQLLKTNTGYCSCCHRHRHYLRDYYDYYYY